MDTNSTNKLSGVITALITPFFEGAIDWDSLKRLLRDQLDAGIQGFVVNGTTGESPTLTTTEVQELLAFVRSEVAGQVPLILGTGSNSTAKTVEMTKKAEQWGADAALVVTPYYNKPPQRGLVEHFQKVSASSDLPLLLYNVPGRTITALEIDTLRILSENSKIVGVKEASGDLEFGQKVIDKCSFLVTSGDDPSCMELALRGGKGVISVISHLIPKAMVELMDRAMHGDKNVTAEYEKYAKLMEMTYCESNPIPVKMAAYLKGLIRSPEMRLPLVSLNDSYKEPLAKALEDIQ